MMKFCTASKLVLFLLLFSCYSSIKAQYNPITVTGFNQDVIGNGTGTSTLATTTREMDAITPSNFVMCSKQFATANGFTPANTYGLPDNGLIALGNKTYQMAPYTASNSLYLYTTETGTLTLTTPAKYTGISLLVLATENNALVNITFNFTDGTTQIANGQTFVDWFSTITANVIMSGFGRVKRKDGPFVATADYEGNTANQPKLYSLEYTLPCSKTLASITFKNNTSTVLTGSNRAFVFAVSGVSGIVPAAPVVNPVTLCAAGPATLTIQNPPTGTNYTWYANLTGGFASGTGVSFTTPSLSANTTYYVLATNAATGCTSDPRTPVTVTIGTRPAAPTANPVSVCPNNAATLTVSPLVTGNTYSWYSAATGGTALATSNSYTTPVITGNTTYYVETTNASGCTSVTRTPVAVTLLVTPAAPAANAVSVCPNNTATLTITTPTTGFIYNWYAAATGGAILGTGTSFTTPIITTSITYYVETVSAAGCVSTTRTPVAVTFLPKLPAPVAQATTIGVNSVTFTWTAVTGAIGYQVSVNNSPYITPSSGNLGLTHVATGLPALTNVTFKVKALGPQICQNSDSATATAKTLTDQIYIPNSFTPNGDGLNDVFKAYGNVIAGVDMKVFNQWGQMIFATTDFSSGWNGSYKGKVQPVGVYIYIMELKLVDGTSVSKKGDINLIR